MTKQSQIAVVGGGVLLVAVVAFFLLRGDADKLPGIGAVLSPARCPLSGEEPKDEALTERPAVAVKVENASIAYPLSGLEKAEVVYEELVEGGVTRFLVIYGCTDTAKAGPVRSARLVDPAIMTPLTNILAFSGSNAPVSRALEEADIVRIEENTAGAAMRRIERAGLTSEHTLYADTRAIRKIGSKRNDDAPSDDVFEFGDLQPGSKRAGSVDIQFSAASVVSYEFKGGRWMRSQGDEPFTVETGAQIGVDNVLIEEHEINLSETIADVAGNPSTEVADVTGRGRAVLFRDGRAITGRWVRESEEDAVRFETRSGDTMVLAPGTTWIHLVPSDRGEVKGSFSFAR